MLFVKKSHATSVFTCSRMNFRQTVSSARPRRCGEGVHAGVDAHAGLVGAAEADRSGTSTRHSGGATTGSSAATISERGAPSAGCCAWLARTTRGGRRVRQTEPAIANGREAGKARPAAGERASNGIQRRFKSRSSRAARAGFSGRFSVGGEGVRVSAWMLFWARGRS